jgi:chloride channel protein, CIC family
LTPIVRPRSIGLLVLSLLAVLMGITTGLGAVAFRALIAVIHNLMFLGHFSFAYNANEFTGAPPWGWLVIFVPVIGSVVVTFLVTNFAPEAKGHGVAEVMDAIFYNQGVIRPQVALVKSLASASSIGTGGSVGREGPIIQIGASIGSTLGQFIAMSPWQRITLVAAGAGAGIAATFNTPIGGVLFAIELIVPEVSVRTFLPVALSTGTATFIGRLFLGTLPLSMCRRRRCSEHKPAQRSVCCSTPSWAACAALPPPSSSAVSMSPRPYSPELPTPICDTRLACSASAY